MTVIVAAIVGFVTGRMIWLALRKTWQRQVFLRKNFQGNTLCTAAGIVLPLALITVEATRSVIGAFGVGNEPAITGPRAAVLIAVTGFALLGLLDDLAGGAEARGFGGHVRALLRGQLTSGSVKMIGGIALSLVASAFLVGDSGAVALLLDAAIIALAANLINLFDLRPGRATKAGMIAFVVIAAIALLDTALVPVAIVVGAAGALILDDLRERLMLGDTGANALGAAIGVGIVTQTGATGRVVVAALLLILNLASEFISFSKVIDSVAPLRAFDMLGRRNNESSVDLRQEAGDGDLPPRANSRVNIGGAPETRSQGTRFQDESAGFATTTIGRHERPFDSEASGVDTPDTKRAADRPFTRNYAPGDRDSAGDPTETDPWQ